MTDNLFCIGQGKHFPNRRDSSIYGVGCNNEEYQTIEGDPFENPVEYCTSVILKEARKEHRLVKQLLYVILSAKTNNPLNLAINSPSGEGKNWVLERAAEKFPSEDVIFLSGMTDKALFHRRGTLVVNKNDFDKNEPTKYESLDALVRDIDDQIQDKKSEIANAKNPDLVKGLKAAIEDLELQKRTLYDHAKKLIDLSHKTLIFLDTPRVNLLTTIMSLLSHDRYEAEYEFVDTHNGIKTYTNIIRGWPAVIFAQAIDYTKHERWPELQRRFIVTNPEMNSKKKYAEAVDLALDKFTLPDLVYQKTVTSDDEKNKVKDILKYVGDEILSISERIDPGKNSTYVPFSEALKGALSKDKSEDMNTAKRFSGFLSLLPMINIGRRPMIKVQTFREDGPVMQTIPLALFEDLKESIYLMEYSNGVRPYVLEWYYEVFLPTYNMREGPAHKTKKIRKDEEETVYESRIAVTTTELIVATKEKKDKSYTSNQLLQTFIYPLMNQGYIDSIESDLDRRAHIYFPVVTIADSKNIILYRNVKDNNFLQPGKLWIRDFTTFPSKPYLISKIQGVIKYYYEEGISVTLCDHEDKEISIEELVEQYYQKPEDYFTDKEPTEAPSTSSSDSSGPSPVQGGGSDNNISESPETGPSHNKTDTIMQELDSSELKDCKKLLSQPKSNNLIFSNPEAGNKQPSPSQTKPYSDYLVNGVPIWQIENRGWTHEEAEAFKEEIARLANGGSGDGKSKGADMAEADISGNGIMPGNGQHEARKK